MPDPYASIAQADEALQARLADVLEPCAADPQQCAKFGKRAAFVGLAREYLDFVSQHGSVFLRPTRDLLELASVIAGSRLFAENQSVGYALAEAMKVDSLLKAYPGCLDCGFSRPNLRQVADGNVPLAWIAGILDSAPHPAEDLQ